MLIEPTALTLRGRTFTAADPAVMGIVNATPDSFYSGARYATVSAALDAVDRMVADGADLVDVGGVRAGQQGEWVDAGAEIDRVRPLLLAIRDRHPDLLLSLDTWRAEVAEACAEARLDLVNDTWQGADPDLLGVAAGIGAGYVVSHTGGAAPRTDPDGVRFGPPGPDGTPRDEPDDVVGDVLATLSAGAERALAAGIPAGSILVDPTLDFGKTTRHSLRVLRATDRVAGLGFPVLQALSRKDFIGETLDLAVEDRLEGTLAATAVATWLGTVCFRAHDVRATRRVVDMVASIRGDRPASVNRRGVRQEQ
ncbi:dihydropteroate synthase [Micropruina sonneratiae]|uniref:dihydropteroate synthase n=1 Tax=Micropruina sonneratiae TaxID=2986940 RepID=UPI0022262C5F|nr:dihydropteroate synthase [Micropruina sp. KQZ13P-5]MCW3159362.1 dihydropteroate synthase [Micropruina sp. KQZ13P-5]